MADAGSVCALGPLGGVAGGIVAARGFHGFSRVNIPLRLGELTLGRGFRTEPSCVALRPSGEIARFIRIAVTPTHKNHECEGQ